MCLITTQVKPRRLTRDKIVWKIILVTENPDIVKSRFTPSHEEWQAGKMKSTTFGISRSLLCECNIFDGTAAQNLRAKAGVRGTIRRFTEVKEGYHAALVKKRLEHSVKDYRQCIRKFFIPKDSLVFTDGSGLIVSNKMAFLPLVEYENEKRKKENRKRSKSVS